MKNHKVKCSNFEIANDKLFTLIAGPCQLENEAHAMKISTELKKITSDLGINLIYKTSFDKANRTSLKGKRGMGLEKSLPIFKKIKKEVGVPVLTDVHTAEQCSIVSEYIDVLQIKYVSQFTPQGLKDYIAMIKWAAYTSDTVVSIPKDKIVTITNATDEMTKSYKKLADNYLNLDVPRKENRYEQEMMSDEDNDNYNQLWDEFRDTKKTYH